jgi:arylsulfatase A-like enzyme
MDEMAMLDPAIEWAVGGGPEPFFLTLLTVTPHHPYEVAGEPWDGANYSQYLRAVRHQDGFVGALYQGLAEAGALDDTVVVLVGDHGEAFGEHQALQHDAVPYDEVVRVPMLMLGPERRIGPPRRVDGLRQHFDLLPTLLELAGAEWKGVVPGRSLLSSEGHPRVFSFCWYPNFCAAMREGEEKFVYHFGRLPTEVFDLATDPGEEHDIAASVDPAKIAAAERRIVAMKLSTEAFYAQFPRHQGEPLWWNAELQAGTSP